MALATVVAGPFNGTWSGSSVGQTEDGFRLQQSPSKQMVMSNSYGDSAIDAVYRGGNVFLTFTGLEYSSAVAAFWPYGAAGVMGQVGRMDVGSSIAAATVLTAVAGTTAATTPATLTASSSLLSETHNGELQFASRARFVPVTLRLYPYASGGSTVWYTVT